MFCLTFLEVVFYAGQFLGAIIFWRLYKMETWTFINKMFMAYFATEFFLGTAEIYLFFKMIRERF